MRSLGLVLFLLLLEEGDDVLGGYGAVEHILKLVGLSFLQELILLELL